MPRQRLSDILSSPFRSAARAAMLAAALVAALGPATRAEDPAESDAGAPALLSKETFARSFLLFERAFARLDRPADEVVDIGLEFDRLTNDFFFGRYDAVRRLDELTLRVESEADREPVSDLERLARSLQVRIDPPVHALSSREAPLLRVASKYPPPVRPADAAPLQVRIVAETTPNGPPLFSRRPPLFADDSTYASWSTRLPTQGLRPGAWLIQTLSPDGEILTERPWSVLDRTPRAHADELLDRLPAPRSLLPRMAEARRVLAARIEYFASLGDPNDTASVVESAPALLEALRAEVDAVSLGADPYANRQGHLWRPVFDADVLIPNRIYAPATNETRGARPLLVALHGAGADEHMFTHAYGAGRLARLADEHGFVVASPNTNVVLGDPSRLGAIIEAVKSDYAIDHDRIYVLGHSMGAGAAAGLASIYPDTLAGVVCIAGGWNLPTNPDAPPVLVIAPELDGIVPARQIERIAVEARAAGGPIQFRLATNQTHTLSVPAILPESVEWLLEQRLSDRAD